MVELGKLDIDYWPRNAIKGQALVDFVAELTPLDSKDNGVGTFQRSSWMVNVDGSSTTLANGVGLLLTTLEGVELEYAIHPRLKAINNEAKYETLIIGLKVV